MLLLALPKIVGETTADHWLIAVAWVGIAAIAAVIFVLSSLRSFRQ